jgi:hypothetical protein
VSQFTFAKFYVFASIDIPKLLIFTRKKWQFFDLRENLGLSYSRVKLSRRKRFFKKFRVFCEFLPL